MDDFRVGSIPSSEAYGDRHPYDAIVRKRHRHREEGQAGEQDEPADTFDASSEAAPEEEDSSASATVEDYYLPSETAGGE
ncbi:MAG TPA: hypothetical protein VMB03_00620 [Bryobacteraceae bacterium]|nr:hypothetical protein [Bryobacteraceae bacterium]